MKLYLQPSSPVTVHLKLNAKEEGSILLSQVLLNEEAYSFIHPLTANKTPKIYIIQNISDQKEILYIGYTSQGIRNRLRFGLDSRYQKNYHGYGWSTQKAEVMLSVWVFQSYTGNREFDAELKRTVQNLEAELAFYVRRETKQWPLFQREIHFGNENQDEVLNWVEQIMDVIKQL